MNVLSTFYSVSRNINLQIYMESTIGYILFMIGLAI